MKALAAAALFLSVTGMQAALAAPPPTRLELTVTGSKALPADTLQVDLMARTESPSAAGAQARLNGMIAAALPALHRVQGLTVTTGAYDVSPVYPRRSSWEARQDLNLTLPAPPGSARAGTLLSLIGTLQSSGLMLESLTGGLSPAMRRKAKDEAISDAVGQLRHQASAAAKALGDEVGPVVDLRLDSGQSIMPRLMRPMAMEAAAPALQAGPVSETVTLSAVVMLQPEVTPGPASP